MNEESQVSGCYNITFNDTNQETVSGNSVGSPLNQMHWSPGKAHTKRRPASAGTLGERGRGGPSAQGLTLQIIRTIKLLPNPPPTPPKKNDVRKEKVKGSWPWTHTKYTRLHMFFFKCFF